MKRLRTGMLLGLAGLLGVGLGAAAFILAGAGGRERPPAPALAVVQVLPVPTDPAAPAAAPYPHADLQPPDEAPLLPGSARGLPHAGRLAIVIDDIGYNLNMPRRFLDLGIPLTFSILPNLPYSREAAGLFGAAGRDYIVHLPMEPLDYPDVNPGPTPLLLAMDATATASRTASYFAALPGAIGASNHMGSAFTADARHMAAVQAVVAQGGRVFLNSLTSNSRVPRDIARARGYPYLERNIFLDNVREVGAVRRQLRKAIRIARRHGRAIAVGHPAEETWRVLSGAFPSARAQGVELVPLSALVRRLPRVWSAERRPAGNPCAAAAAPMPGEIRTSDSPVPRAG